VLAEILTRPTVRAETVLDGIFSQAVVVLEADGDRTVYQAVYESLADELRLDIHFTAVGGTGGIADTCRVYRTLKIPIAVITDLDIIAESDRLGRVVSALTHDTHAATIVAAAREVAAAIKDLPPTVDPEDVRRRLEAAAALPRDWAQNHDDSLRSFLQDLTHDLDRMRRLKRGGVAALPRPLIEQASSLITALAEVGVFVVPVGELEAWLADRAIGASKRTKWSWANEAAARVRHLGPQTGDVWDCIRSVGAYLALGTRQ